MDIQEKRKCQAAQSLLKVCGPKGIYSSKSSQKEEEGEEERYAHHQAAVAVAACSESVVSLPGGL